MDLRRAMWVGVVAVGATKAAGVLLVAPHVGMPWGLALAAAALWATGPALAAAVWRRRARAKTAVAGANAPTAE